MTDSTVPTTRYTQTQIMLHWLVVGLVAFQFLTGGGMAGWFFGDAVGGTAFVHGTLGLSILAAMLARLAVRRRRGAPPPAEPETIGKASRINHFAFYGLLIVMPLFGLAAVLTGSGILAVIHGWASKLLLALIVLHIAGAVYHLAVRRDGVGARMLRLADPEDRDRRGAV